jgi:Eco29kI restriction endonuclease
MAEIPYNPLDKLNLARSIEHEVLKRVKIPLANSKGIEGAGVYVLYYQGPFKPYEPLSGIDKPIYIGKAIPKGGRKGGIVANASSQGRAMADRLAKHARSISAAVNLDLADFQVRFLMVDDIWIPLGENMLIEQARPVWNVAIDGFGNNDPGQRRAAQYKSPWDILHPGRDFAEKLADGGLSIPELEQRIADHFAGRTPKGLPPAVLSEQEAIKSEAEEAADES